tara:strand:- start:114 stop:824 length:711 start_codon:yes stop_codon:yes gene_type:complete
MQEIIQKGVMRSGNVLLRLILNHIFNEVNISIHTYRFFGFNDFIYRSGFSYEITPHHGIHRYEDIPNNNILIIPWRDPRDSIMSWIRTEYSKQNTDKFPTLEYILENCERTAKEQIEQFDIITKMYKQHPKKNTLEIKYENFHNNFDVLFNKLEKFFKIKIPLETREYLKKEFSKEQTIQFQKALGSNFNYYEPTTHLHGEHVYKGDNKWKEVLTPEILDIINPILDPYIKKWESL